MSPSSLRSLAIALAVVYFVWPVDLIPDRFGVFGRLDDVLVAGYLFWKTWGASTIRRAGARAQQTATAGGTTANHDTPSPERSPFEILEVSKNASRDEIDNRYRELMKQYHPDRVAHLGKELQELAHEKTIEIQGAYQAIVGNA
jgi:DnaJ like chaperone protein